MLFAAINAHLDSPNSVKRLCAQFQGSRITTEQIKRICQIGPFPDDLDFEGVKSLCAACLASRLQMTGHRRAQRWRALRSDALLSDRDSRFGAHV